MNRKKTGNIALYFIIIAGIPSCSKNNEKIAALSSLIIMNAVVNSDSIVANFTTDYIPFFQQKAFLPFPSSSTYSLQAGSTPITVLSTLDTIKPSYDGIITLAPGSFSTLYLFGQFPTVEAMQLTDTIPIITDSTAGVRFINLCPDSKAISVNLAGNYPTIPEFINLNYKQITSFKKYNAQIITSGSYNFEIRDQATGNLLTTYNWVFVPFKSNALTITGLENNGTVQVSQINYY